MLHLLAVAAPSVFAGDGLGRLGPLLPPWLSVALALATLGMAGLSAGHALITKRDPRAALGWVAVCLIFPLAGPLLYFVFGVNRIQTRARRLRWRPSFRFLPEGKTALGPRPPEPDVRLPEELAELNRLAGALSSRPLVAGNRVDILHNGEETFPAMLREIQRAERSLYLSTYIFETNRSGRQMVEALAQAAERGVEVKVLVDGVGELYSFPRVTPLLAERGVPVARFLPPRLLPPAVHINLRNHRKILTVDGQVGFVGGMNLGDRHLVGGGQRSPEETEGVVDAHFRLEGPVVSQIEQVFLDDWDFATGRTTPPPRPRAEPAGEAFCRTLVDGPNHDLNKLTTLLVGAVSQARRRVTLMTPYFLPPQELIAALQTAALKGVEVTVILPGASNLPVVHWASRNLLWEVLQRGVRVYYQPPPFVHTKLFMVDGAYAQVGSANLDPRSLRLNFELVVEVYDAAFVGRLENHAEGCRQRSREVTLEEVDGRPLPVRLRDALAWLFSPYL